MWTAPIPCGWINQTGQAQYCSAQECCWSRGAWKVADCGQLAASTIVIGAAWPRKILGPAQQTSLPRRYLPSCAVFLGVLRLQFFNMSFQLLKCRPSQQVEADHLVRPLVGLTTGVD